MTPLLACFPMCLTFVALAVLGLLVLATGAYSRVMPAGEPEEPAADPPDGSESGRPPLWVAALIFAVVLLHFAVALWLWPEF